MQLLDRVRERDIDLLLLSALFASEQFRSSILRHVLNWSGPHNFVSGRVSEWDGGRESDIVLLIDLEIRGRVALMIENKIDAIFQPEQAEDYQTRGQRGILQGLWTEFLTCLCAPHNRITRVTQTKEWNAYLSFESIITMLEGVENGFCAFSGAVLRQAITKFELNSKQISPATTDFWQKYRDLAGELLPGVHITRVPQQNTATAPWPCFGANILPQNLSLEHKPENNRVDLTFNKCPIDSLRQRIPESLPIDIRPTKAGGSSALRIAVPRVDHLKPFEEQQDQVLSVLAAVERLLAIGRQLAKLNQS